MMATECTFADDASTRCDKSAFSRMFMKKLWQRRKNTSPVSGRPHRHIAKHTRDVLDSITAQ